MFAVVRDATSPHRVDELVDAVLSRFAVSQNAYLRDLTGGTMSREQFVGSQLQFCHAVDYFSRPMAVLASRLPHAEQRVSILHNVWEEHGEGNLAFHHGTTFRKFLGVLIGAEPSITAPGPAVGMFNATLAGVCGTDEPLAGVAALGIIERMFADISAVIGSSVVERGWVAREELVHYATHETLDLEHADEFFEIARRGWDAGRDARAAFERGLWLGAYAFDQFYRGLSQ